MSAVAPFAPPCEAAWLPVETAPRDGTEITGLINGDPVQIRWAEERICMLANVAPGAGRFGEGWEDVLNGLIVDDPTGWLPIVERREVPERLPIGELGWAWRVQLTERQAVVGIPAVVWIGAHGVQSPSVAFDPAPEYAICGRWTDSAESIYELIAPYQGDTVIPRDVVLAGIRLLQDAIRADTTPAAAQEPAEDRPQPDENRPGMGAAAFFPPPSEHDDLIRAALRVIAADHYGRENDPHGHAEAEYASEQLVLAARAYATAVDALPEEQHPIGWPTKTGDAEMLARVREVLAQLRASRANDSGAALAKPEDEAMLEGWGHGLAEAIRALETALAEGGKP